MRTRDKLRLGCKVQAGPLSSRGVASLLEAHARNKADASTWATQLAVH